MRHVIVTRVTAFLTGLVLAAAVLFTWLTTPAKLAAPDAVVSTDGARLFEAYCASCHTPDALRPAFRDLTPGQRQVIEAFLTRHGEAATEDDLRILEYLARKNPQPPD